MKAFVCVFLFLHGPVPGTKAEFVLETVLPGCTNLPECSKEMLIEANDHYQECSAKVYDMKNKQALTTLALDECDGQECAPYIWGAVEGLYATIDANAEYLLAKENVSTVAFYHQMQDEPPEPISDIFGGVETRFFAFNEAMVELQAGWEAVKPVAYECDTVAAEAEYALSDDLDAFDDKKQDLIENLPITYHAFDGTLLDAVAEAEFRFGELTRFMFQVQFQEWQGAPDEVVDECTSMYKAAYETRAGFIDMVMGPEDEDDEHELKVGKKVAHESPGLLFGFSTVYNGIGKGVSAVLNLM